mgnify:CR=1 FL=1
MTDTVTGVVKILIDFLSLSVFVDLFFSSFAWSRQAVSVRPLATLGILVCVLCKYNKFEQISSFLFCAL